MEKTCPYCNKIFKTFDKRQRFCSSKCGHQNRSANRIIIKANCKHCGKEFIVKPSGPKLFCSLDCFHKWNTKDRIKLICENCGKEFYDLPVHSKHRRNCSKKCKYELLGKENSERFKGIPVKKLSDRRQLDIYRQIAFDNLPNCCHICSEQVEKLEVHHIDGDRNNNSIDNLIILCRGCHRSIHKMTSKHNISVIQSLSVLKIMGKPPKRAYCSVEWQKKLHLAVQKVSKHLSPVQY